MRISFGISWAAAVLLLDAGLAHGLQLDEYQAQSNECALTLSATGSSFPHPAGQLGDGILRLNVPQPPAIFFIDEQNSVTDSNGYGCFAAESCGLQCQSGTPSAQGFSIDSSFTLLHNDSPQFYACPVDNNGYGIFVQLPVDKSKCISIALKTNSSCSAAPPLHQSPSSQASPSTIWRTSTITDLTTQSVTVVVTVCKPSSTLFFKSTPSPYARGLDLQNLSPRVLAPRYLCPEVNDRKLSKRAPGDLNNCWNYVKKEFPQNFVKQNAVLEFPLNMEEEGQFATDEYFGCTVIIFVGKEKLAIAHMPEGMGKICPLSSPELTEQYIISRLDELTFPVVAKDEKCDNLYVIITGTEMDTKRANNGVSTLKESIMKTYGVRPENLRYIAYTTTTSSSELGNPRSSNPVMGRSYIKWAVLGITGTITIYLGNEDPRLEVNFFTDWTTTENGVTWASSRSTTDGNGNRA